MTRDEAVASIQFDLGARTDLFDQIVAKLQRAQEAFEMGHTLPWFLKEEDASLVLPAGSADVAFPTGFLQECSQDEAFHFTSVDDAALVYLEKLPVRIGNARFVSTSAGPPVAYAIRKSGWKFWPARDTSYTLTYSYFKSGTSLATNAVDNAWLVRQPDLLIGKAGADIATIFGDTVRAQMFQARFRDAWLATFGDTVMRDEENYNLSMGSRL